LNANGLEKVVKDNLALIDRQDNLPHLVIWPMKLIADSSS